MIFGRRHLKRDEDPVGFAQAETERLTVTIERLVRSVRRLTVELRSFAVIAAQTTRLSDDEIERDPLALRWSHE